MKTVGMYGSDMVSLQRRKLIECNAGADSLPWEGEIFRHFLLPLCDVSFLGLGAGS